MNGALDRDDSQPSSDAVDTTRTDDSPGSQEPGRVRADSHASETKAEWSIAIVAVVISLALLAWGRGHTASAGARFPISITVIPPDAINLDCASDAKFGDLRCNFDAREQPQHVAQPFRPYVSTGRELWLLSGVFEQPAVHDWLTQARRAGSNARVTIDCQAQLLGQLESVPVRWQTGAAFAAEKAVPAASVSDCHVVR